MLRLRETLMNEDMMKKNGRGASYPSLRISRLFVFLHILDIVTDILPHHASYLMRCGILEIST